MSERSIAERLDEIAELLRGILDAIEQRGYNEFVVKSNAASDLDIREIQRQIIARKQSKWTPTSQ